MIINAPDPHPGRCESFRRDRSDPYCVKTMRCLRMEGHEGQCRFPDPPPRLHSTINSGGWVSQAKPEPWVEPA